MQDSIIIPFIFYFLIVIGIGVYTTRFSSKGVSEFCCFCWFFRDWTEIAWKSPYPGEPHAGRTNKGRDHVESRP